MKNVLIVLILFNLVGCVLTEEGYPQKEVIIKLDKNYEIELIRGKSKVLKTFDRYNITKVIFERVRGGKTYLFGKEIKDTGNGYKYKRLKLKKDGEVVNRYSYNDVVAMKTEIIDTFKVYEIPD